MSSSQYLGIAASGAGVYLRLESKTFNRLAIAQDQAEELGIRVAEEFEKDAAQDPSIRERTKMILLENTFHSSSADDVPHATVSYEDDDGNYVISRPKHVAQNPAEQAKSDENAGKE